MYILLTAFDVQLSKNQDQFRLNCGINFVVMNYEGFNNPDPRHPNIYAPPPHGPKNHFYQYVNAGEGYKNIGADGDDGGGGDDDVICVQKSKM